MPVLSLTLISAREILRMETPWEGVRSKNSGVRTQNSNPFRDQKVEGTLKFE
jgi:hypothetical protein